MSFRIVEPSTVLTDNDIEIYRDYYVIVTRDNVERTEDYITGRFG